MSFTHLRHGRSRQEMAAEHPEAEFTGLDIAPLQPATVLPVNCRFEIRNMLDCEWRRTHAYRTRRLTAPYHAQPRASAVPTTTLTCCTSAC